MGHTIKRNNINRNRNIFIFLFTAPTFLLFLVFVLMPIIQGLYYSLFSWSGLSTSMSFLGFNNYKRLISDSIVWGALKNDLLVAGLRLAFQLALSLLFSLFLTRIRVIGNQLFRNVIFFPVMLSAVIICTVWMMMYNPNFGVISNLYKLVGLPLPEGGFVGDYRTALLSVVPPAIWCSVGFYMLILISAIENMPDSIFESAVIDGTPFWRQTTAIILPLLRPQINFCVVYMIITSMNGTYLLVKLLTDGGPNNASQVLGTYMMVNGFQYHQFGYATAISALILAVTLIISGVLNKFFSSEAYEF